MDKITTIERVADKVAAYFDISKEQILSWNRMKQSDAYIKAMFVYLCRKVTTATYDTIGEYMNGRDHTTIAMYHRLYCDLGISLPYIQEHDTNEIKKMILSEDDAYMNSILSFDDSLILTYLDSDSIRTYLMEIKYSFSLIEKMYLILELKKICHQEKVFACLRLIRGSEDYEFGTITNYDWEERFSNFTVKTALIDWIKMKTDLCRFFDDGDNEDKNQNDVEYSFFVTYYDIEQMVIDDSMLFDNLRSCKRYIRNSDAYNCNFDNIEKIYITKTYHEINGKYRFTPIDAVFDKYFNLLNIDICEYKKDYDSEDGVTYLDDCEFDRKYYDFRRRFKNIIELCHMLYVEIPIPFERGDTVYDKFSCMKFKIEDIGKIGSFVYKDDMVPAYGVTGKYYDENDMLTDKNCIVYGYLGLEWGSGK